MLLVILYAGIRTDSRPRKRYPWDVRWTGILSSEVPVLRIFIDIPKIDLIQICR